jgi:hypothetical protein
MPLNLVSATELVAGVVVVEVVAVLLPLPAPAGASGSSACSDWMAAATEEAAEVKASISASRIPTEVPICAVSQSEAASI